MSTHTSERVRSASPGRSNGQWLVDGHAPLNHNEEFKGVENPLNVRARIDEYARQGFDSIAEDDLYGRFRWLGIYTQRKQGIDGGRTGTLSAEELSDRYFMMRIRVDGGRLTTEQTRVIAGISNEFARGTADISDRQNIQLHWIEIESVPEIFRRLESVGLSTTTACGDTPRVFLGSPVAGVAADELIDSGPVLESITSRYVGSEEVANLPRKFKTSVTGNPSLDALHEINDVSFVAVEHPELGIGFDLWVGGALSTTPRLSERLGAFVTVEQVPDVWFGVVRIFRDYGYRRLRNKARMKFLLADWGPEKFRQVLQDEYLGYELADGPAPKPATGSADHVGVHEQKDGRLYVGLAPTVGRISGDVLAGLADAAEAAGSERLSLTPHQKVVVLDVDPARLDAFLAAVEPLGLTATPSPFRRHTMACTGIEYCKLAFVNTKDTARTVIGELEKRFDGETIDTPITLHVNGCPNSSARIQTADIGLKGQLMKSKDGADEFAYQVHLGGRLAENQNGEPGFGRTVRGLKVSADDLPDYVERVVRSFLAERDGAETFAEWAHRAEEDSLK